MKSLLQTREWVNLKVSQGWQPHEVDEIFVLKKNLPLGYSFLYAPEVNYSQLKIENFLLNIKKIAQEKRSIFFRLEISDENDQKIIENLKKNNFIKSFEEIQPEWRQIVDISKTEEEILSGMKPKGRYNIKIAQKHGVAVSACPVDRLVDGTDIFYNLFRETSKNQGFSIRSREYFYELLKDLYPGGYARLLIARYNNIPVAALVVTFYDGVASYLYGASTSQYRKVMAPYLLHWETIKLAKAMGCQKYDLLAIAPEGSLNHKYTGITRFKEQFGGRKINIVGSWDMVYRPVMYRLFKMIEQLRRK